MMRSMYTAVSGLRTHQGKMDTIGHNIANVNTVGYKRGQVTFKEAFSQMLAGASGPQGGKGGTNPQQVGLGVNTGAINTVHTVGGMQRTENPTDLMINGEGFFTVTDDTSYNNKYFTRDGSLNIDVDGNLVTSDGYMVLGYMFDENGNITDRYERIRIDQNEEVPPEATRSITFSGNLNSNLTIEGSGESTDNNRAEWPIVDTIIYDSLGNEYQLSFRLEKEVKDKTGGGTEDLDNKAGDKEQKWKLNLIRMENLGTGYYAEVTKDSDGDVKDNPFSGAFEGTSFTFNDMGKLIKVGEEEMEKVELNINGEALANVSLNKNDSIENLEDENAEKIPGKFGDANGKIRVIDGKNPNTYRHITQYANATDIKPVRDNGNTSGSLDGFTIDTSGTVIGRFTNGVQKGLGRIVLSKFSNPTGLEKMGNNLFATTRNSGDPQLGTAGDSGFGSIASSTLEMSNVDISFEFTEMITTQRGFQANSRVITTSDEMLQELVNIKR